MNTNRMSCGETREKLPLFVGGDLDGDVLECVRRHLDSCGDCARRAEEAALARRELVAAFRAREVDFAQPQLWPGIRAVLRAEGRFREAGEPVAPLVAPVRERGARWTWAFAPVVAAAVVLVVAQLGGGFSRPGTKIRPGPEAPQEGHGLVVTPVGSPASGSLRRVDPSEPSALPAPYQRPLRQGEPRLPSAGDVSLTGLRGLK